MRQVIQRLPIPCLMLLAGACLTACEAPAATIVGGSSILDSARANQLEAWLGEGPITLTNIFTKVAGDGQTAPDFHAAADGKKKGRTFTVMQVRADDGVTGYVFPEIIGGYNPQSWSSSDTFNVTPNTADATAFLFNLTDSVAPRMQSQKDPSVDNGGEFQTYNTSAYGPTFGGGHDIFSDYSLEGTGGELCSAVLVR